MAIKLDQELSHLLASANRAYCHNKNNNSLSPLGDHVGSHNLCEYEEIDMLCTPSPISS